MALAFAGTVGLAQILVKHRTGEPQTSLEQAPPGWPIEFELPAGYRWTRATEISPLVRLTATDDRNQALYIGRNPSGQISQLQIQYKLTPAGTSTEEAAAKTFRLPPSGHEEIELGSLSWLVGISEDDFGLFAVACDASGVAVHVLFSFSETARQEIVAFCSSVELKDSD